MFSLIKYFLNKEPTLNITSSNPTSVYRNATNALETSDDKFFYSKSSPYFWQVEFPHAVTIESYILSSYGGESMRVWEVSFSLDNTSFSSLPAFSADTYKNKKIFLLPFPIYCKYFKITCLLSAYYNTYNERYMAFNSFDCFGSLTKKQIRVNNQCSLNFAQKMKNIILTTMIMTHISA